MMYFFLPSDGSTMISIGVSDEEQAKRVVAAMGWGAGWLIRSAQFLEAGFLRS